jgi:hypothetical protein
MSAPTTYSTRPGPHAADAVITVGGLGMVAYVVGTVIAGSSDSRAGLLCGAAIAVGGALMVLVAVIATGVSIGISDGSCDGRG